MSRVKFPYIPSVIFAAKINRRLGGHSVSVLGIKINHALMCRVKFPYICYCCSEDTVSRYISVLCFKIIHALMCRAKFPLRTLLF